MALMVKRIKLTKKQTQFLLKNEHLCPVTKIGNDLIVRDVFRDEQGNQVCYAMVADKAAGEGSWFSLVSLNAYFSNRVWVNEFTGYTDTATTKLKERMGW
jgi:hypothetical protein